MTRLAATAFIFLFLLAPARSEDASFSVPVPPAEEILKTLRPGHPRLIVPAGEERRVMELIERDEQAGVIFETIRKEADGILKEEPVAYKIDIRSQPTILMTSRKAQDRIVTLSTLYRLTKDRKYLDRAVLELETVCRFEDWNHRCFLDTAEMIFAVAIGYDWLYHDLTPEHRRLFVDAIREKGLLPGKEAYEKKVSWTRTRNNWNQVCSGGLIVGALAIAESEPELSTEIVHRAARGVQTAMNEFAPDGGTTEGPTYWAYAVNFTVYMLAAMDSALGTDFGLSGFPGFSTTGDFRCQLITPLKTQFTFGDSGPKAGSNQSMYWLAKKFDRPDYAWEDRTLFAPNRPFALWWFSGEGGTGKLPPAAHFKRVGIVLMRSSWEPDALFVGLKGGSNAAGHSHLELGHFQLIGDERVWLDDLGGVPYTADYFRADKRWTFYRATNLAHNVPHIDGKLQNPKAAAPVTLFETSPEKTVAELDLSDAYRGQVDKASRRVSLEGRTLTVEDSFGGVRGETLTWQVHLPVRRVLIDEKNPRVAHLQHFYKRMRVEISEPDDAVFEIEEIKVPEPQPSVKDTIRLVIRRKVTPEPIRLKVRFTPQTPAPQKN